MSRRRLHRVALLYANGLGGKGDLSVAAEWYRKSAAQGNEKAKEALGHIEGVMRNDQIFKNVMTKYLDGGYGGDTRQGAQQALKEIREKQHE